MFPLSRRQATPGESGRANVGPLDQTVTVGPTLEDSLVLRDEAKDFRYIGRDNNARFRFHGRGHFDRSLGKAANYTLMMSCSLCFASSSIFPTKVFVIF